MASPWIFTNRLLARCEDMYNAMAFDIEKKINIAPLPTTRFAIADNSIKHANDSDQQQQVSQLSISKSSNLSCSYHKKLALLWMQYLDIEKHVPHSIFTLILQYDGFVQSLLNSIQHTFYVPMKIHKIMGGTPLVFCESQDDTLALIKSTPGIKKEMPLYKILAIAHIHNRSVCPWAPLHFNMSDDVFARYIWN